MKNMPDELKQVVGRIGVLISQKEAVIKNEMATRGLTVKNAVGIYTETDEEILFIIVDTNDESGTEAVSKCFRDADLKEFQNMLKRDPAGFLRVYAMVSLGKRTLNASLRVGISDTPLA